MLHIFKDLADYLNPLNSIFQEENLKVTRAFSEIELTVHGIQDLLDSNCSGHHFEEFYNKNKDSEIISFHDVQLTRLYAVNPQGIKVKCRKLQERLLSHLKARFPSQKEIQLFTVFDSEKNSDLRYRTEKNKPWKGSFNHIDSKV